jgi:release factor glutamine methyltransferase
MNILELLQKTTVFFEKAGVLSPRLDIELILTHVLRMKRMDLYLQFERSLSEAELNTLRSLVKRRAAREPLQHILGSVDFCGLEILTTKDALIPRPETEILAQIAIDKLGKTNAKRALDIGTGTGALTLAILHACPQARAVAVDISTEALKLAESNAVRNHLQERVQFRQGDLFDPVVSETFDLIVSNPPYIPSGEIAGLQPEVQYDPLIALDGGPDGLDLIRKLAGNAMNFLTKGAPLLLEIGHNQSNPVLDLFKEKSWAHAVFHHDLQGIPRFVCAQYEP